MIWKQSDHSVSNAKSRDKSTPSAGNRSDYEDGNEDEDESSEGSSHGLLDEVFADLMEDTPSEKPNRIPSDRVQGTALKGDQSRATTLRNQNEEDREGRSSLAQV